LPTHGGDARAAHEHRRGDQPRKRLAARSADRNRPKF
jgi:hypothetical protein